MANDPSGRTPVQNAEGTVEPSRATLFQPACLCVLQPGHPCRLLLFHGAKSVSSAERAGFSQWRFSNPPTRTLVLEIHERSRTRLRISRETLTAWFALRFPRGHGRRMECVARRPSMTPRVVAHEASTHESLHASRTDEEAIRAIDARRGGRPTKPAAPHRPKRYRMLAIVLASVGVAPPIDSPRRENSRPKCSWSDARARTPTRP